MMIAKTRQVKSLPQGHRKRKLQVRQLGNGDFLTDSTDAASSGAGPHGARVEKRSLGERLRDARELRGLTLEDLSSRSGVSVDGLERVESNRTIPPLGQLVRLGKALEMVSAGEPRNAYRLTPILASLASWRFLFVD